MLRDTGERLIMNSNWNLKTKMEHLHRYTIISKYTKGKVVLDAACGTGYGTEIISRNAKKIYGIDLDTDAIDYCNEKYHKDNLHYIKMSVTELDFPNEMFDIVVSFETFEHISYEDEVKFLNEIKRVLKKDGILVLSVPNDTLLRRLVYGNYVNEFHLVDFSERKFVELLQKYFENVKLYYQTVSSSSTILKKTNLSDATEMIVDCDKIDAENERFYIALCSDAVISEDFSLQSVYRPNLEDYYNEHYFEKSAYVYLDTGNGYDGVKSCRAVCISVDNIGFSYKFRVYDANDVCGIRFDPTEHAGMYKITKCYVNNNEVQIRAINSSNRIDDIDIFDEIDPQYEVVEFEKSDYLEINIEGQIIKTVPDYLVWNKTQDKIRLLEQEIQLKLKDNEVYILENVKLKEQLSQLNKIIEEEYTKRIINQLQVAIQNEKSDLQKTIIMEIAKNNIDIENKIEDLSKKEEREIAEFKKYIEGELETIKTINNQELHTINDMQYIWSFTNQYKKVINRIRNKEKQGVKIPLKQKVFTSCYTMIKKSKMLNNLALKVYQKVKVLNPNLAIKIDKGVFISKLSINDIGEFNQKTDNTYYFEKFELIDTKDKPLVSVIVPNYNHEKYLKERLDSIYNQTYTNIEVILLDDCSTDNSRDILMDYARKHKQNTRTCFNECNVGKVNLQWNKGLSLAKGEYIWIAESDDWCEPDFLEKLVPELNRQSVMIAFARSVFMKNNEKCWSTEEYLYDTPIDWTNSFIMSGSEAVNKGFYKKNFIPNVSSAIFRNIGKIPDEVMDIWKDIKLCGDWLFYLYIIKGGAFSYRVDTTNYYRIHDKSTSLNVQKTEEYYKETEIISKYIAKNFKTTTQMFEQVLEDLERHYLTTNPNGNPALVREWYHVDQIDYERQNRIPNIMICNFSMKVGGGEIFPIHLANELRRQGVAVTFVDCNMEEYNESIRNKLDKSIPLFRLKELIGIYQLPDLFGIEVIHSHHASVDKLIAEYVENKNVKQVITLHGMYETIDISDLSELLKFVCKRCSIFAYISDKNLLPFKKMECFDICNFVRVNNGVCVNIENSVKRNELNIPDESFVYCLVSRARFDKGWLEAVEAIDKANLESEREIHLILVGDGPAYDNIIQNCQSRFIHAVGSQQNPVDYFAISDMGLLPSYFAGESVPLTVIECLMTGHPVLASDVGEIKKMLMNDFGIAGEVFALENEHINIDVLKDCILKYANDSKLYEQVLENSYLSSQKFDLSNIAKTYINIYNQCFDS